MLMQENEVKEINRMRKERVHKARPVKHFKGVEVKPSDKKLTEPMTPMFVRHRK
jgi:targeting protein for Xklp2